jgi:hypothetical protein
VALIAIFECFSSIWIKISLKTYWYVHKILKKKIMATNPPSGDGHRNGAVRNRSQVYNPKTEQWVKRDKDTGRFMDVKQDGTPFKGVRKEK